jgi:hypothetical protein
MYSRVEKLSHDVADFSKDVRQYFTSFEFWLPFAAIAALLILVII